MTGELPPSTCSEASCLFAVERFRDCTQNHDKCRSVGKAGGLPTRLICLNSIKDSEAVSLVLSQDVTPEPYLSLSHRWGSAQFSTLTKQNYSALRNGIRVSELPKTFRDCFAIARRLEIRYVWIDSLCIIQDDPDDWLREASQMHEVYANSLCNICATGSSDTSQGLFTTRDPRLFQPCTVDIPWIKQGQRFRIFEMSLWKTQVLEAPLNKRAWVVQEHLLAPRQIHFGAQQILWECCELHAAEQYPKGLPTAIEDPALSPFNSWQSASPEPETADSPSAPSLQDSWSKIVQSYTNAVLTYPKDKVVAFAGIAKRFETLLKDENVAGLWRTNIECHLLWHVDFCLQGDGTPSARPDTYRAPSFSWISIDGRIFSDGDPKVCDLLVQASDVEVVKSRGLIVDGSLRLKGSLRPFKLQRIQVPSGPMWYLESWVSNAQRNYHQWGSLGPGAFAWMDVDEDYSGIFYGMPIRDEWGGRLVAGLVLRESGNLVGEFQRVGMFVAMSNGARMLVLEDNDDQETYPYLDAGSRTISII